jgi:hypothetical protein
MSQLPVCFECGNELRHPSTLQAPVDNDDFLGMEDGICELCGVCVCMYCNRKNRQINRAWDDHEFICVTCVNFDQYIDYWGRDEQKNYDQYGDGLNKIVAAPVTLVGPSLLPSLQPPSSNIVKIGFPPVK